MTRRQQGRRARRRTRDAERARARRRAAAGAGLGFGLFLGIVPAAQATDYTVTNTGDIGGGSLRDAITTANGTPVADRILFQSGLTGTIALGSALPPITKPLEIAGPGAANLTVSGGGTSHILQVSYAVGYTDVKVSGLTLSGGLANTLPAGGAISSSGDLTVEDCLITGNTSFRGGGLFLSGGTNVVRDTTIQFNHATDTTSGYGGGGIANYGTTNVEGSTISGNDSLSEGGGIHTRGNMTITDSSIQGNLANAPGIGYGGGISAYTVNLTIQGSTVSGNSAALDGAGLRLRSVNATIESTTISGNTGATTGGGIWADSGSLSLQDATVAGNSATNGGGINSANHSVDPQLLNTIVADNTATTGPDIRDAGSDPFQIDFSLIENTSGAGFVGSTASSVLGVDPQLGPLAPHGGPTRTRLPGPSGPAVDKGKSVAATDQRGTGFLRTVDDPGTPNSAATGANGADIGAVELQQPVDFTVTNLNNSGPGSLQDRIAQVEAHQEGGVDRILFQPGLSGTINLAPAFAQLPLITQPVKIDGSGATVTLSGGGANRIVDVDTKPGDDVSLTALKLTAGSAPGALGGAIRANHADLTLDGSTVSGSNAGVGGGIGVIANSEGTTTIRTSTISGNQATSRGGGIDAYGTEKLVVDRSTISGNSTPGPAGGIYPGGVYDFSLSNSTVSGNSAGGGGGGMFIYLGQVTTENSTIANNTGGGIRGYLPGVSLSNSIVADNTAPDVALDNFAFPSASFSLIETGDISDTVPGSNITGEDPQLGPLASNGGPTQTQRPARTSPVVDHGKRAGSPVIDQRGLARPFDVPALSNSTAAGADGADMGAVELTLAEASPPPVAKPPAVQPPAKCKKQKKKKGKKAAAWVAKKCKKKKKKK